MSRIRVYTNATWIAFVFTFILVGVGYAQSSDGGNDLLAPFGPILVGALGVERLLQLIRNIISPKPKEGYLKRGSKELRYFTTFGGAILGLLFAFASDLRLLASAGIGTDPTLDVVITGIVVGMGSEVVHEAIKVVAETKGILRAKQ